MHDLAVSDLAVVGRGLGLIEYAVICLEIVKFGESLGRLSPGLLAIAAAMVTMRRRRAEGDRRQLAKRIWTHRWISCWEVSGCRPGPLGSGRDLESGRGSRGEGLG